MKNSIHARSRLFAAAVLPAWLACAAPQPAWAADWPQAGCNAQHTGYTDDSPAPLERAAGNQKGGEEKVLYYPMAWAADFRPEEIRHAQPVAAGGRLFIGTLQGNFYALSAETGERLWHFPTEPSGIGLPIFLHAAVGGGRVFFAGMNGRLYALDASDGSEIWRAQFGAPVSAAPCVAEGMIYIGDRWGEFAAVDASSGAVKWRRQLSFVVDSTAAYHDGKVFVITEDSTAHCLAAADGAELWRFKAPGGGLYRGQHPVVHNGRVLFRVTPMAGSHQYNHLARLFDWLNGEELEKAQALGRRISEAKRADRLAPLPGEVLEPLQALLAEYEAKPYNQTFYVLDEDSGRQPYVAVHFHSCGYLAAGIMAPAVCRDGAVVMTVPWLGRSNFGLFDPAKNELIDISTEKGGTNPDEDHYASVGGDRIFFSHFRLGGCSNEGMWNPVDRSTAYYEDERVLRGGARQVSVLKPAWTPDAPLYDRRQWGGHGAAAISGNMFFRQERSMVLAWRGRGD